VRASFQARPEGRLTDMAKVPPDDDGHAARRARAAASRFADRPLANGRTDTWRHPAWVRLAHWLNVIAVVVLIMSGLNILLAHPHLYWGVRSTFADPWMSIPPIPNWLLIPQGRNLAEARNYHFLFAWIFVLNGLAYLTLGLITRRFGRRLVPTSADLKGLGPSIVEHARFHFPTDDHARAYNVIQKLTYLAMILIVLPMMLITGLSMSPGFNAIGGILLDIMGGRQSARTLHFISAALIVGFIAIHVGLVIWTGLFNNMRAMITGWFVIEPPGSTAGPKRRRKPPTEPGDPS
jgi:thiosulfate reductase cytochrome b subunit